MGLFGGSSPRRRQPTTRRTARAGRPAARPAAKAAPAGGFEAECEQAMIHLQALTGAHAGAWHLDECDWAADQDSGLITFTDSRRGVRITAPMQIIGTYDTDAGTWLWAWANPSLRHELTADAQRLKRHGQAKGYAALTAPKLRCDEAAAWRLAALACRLCDRQGAYRGPAGTTQVLFTFDAVSIAKLG